MIASLIMFYLGGVLATIGLAVTAKPGKPPGKITWTVGKLALGWPVTATRSIVAAVKAKKVEG